MQELLKEIYSKCVDAPPLQWQERLAAEAVPSDRILRIPTGFGKTLGVLLAWLYHRALQKDSSWPRRLVWCLPMRTLVEQTSNEAKRVIQRLGLQDQVDVHVLMGGAERADWARYPERDTILIGTQDMLLSRALNRGYGAARGRWPMEFGLLNQDCLWVFDEIQLMDVGFATGLQLQALRAQWQQVKPCYTWWMSATLQKDWFMLSEEARETAERVPVTRLAASAETGDLWSGVTKHIAAVNCSDAQAITTIIADELIAGCRDVLVVLNTVELACEVYSSLQKWISKRDTPDAELRLIHSRFRPAERSQWSKELRSRRTWEEGGCARVLVSTQVIEAGVDLSCELLVTELAPWASLVQRFGRCARWGGTGRVKVVDRNLSEKKCAPYAFAELEAARDALSLIQDVSPRSLEMFESQHPELLLSLYPYDPGVLLRSRDLVELFDTSPDLSGQDIDVSRYIRSGVERDLQVCWIEVDAEIGPDPEFTPARDALCSVPFLKAREWLIARNYKKSPSTTAKCAWVWDWELGRWYHPKASDLYPGRTVVVDAEEGGYKPDTGWDPKSKKAVEPVDIVLSEEKNDEGQRDTEALSSYPWLTIATHGKLVGDEVHSLASELVPESADLLQLAAWLHDLGKAHSAFQACLIPTTPGHPQRRDLAKAPQEAWKPLRSLYSLDGRTRKGFRHELASVLALMDLLQRYAPDHEAFGAELREVLYPESNAKREPETALLENSILKQLAGLDASRLNLLLYLLCAHHGKIRVTWHASADDLQATDGRLRGICKQDTVAETKLWSGKGYCTLPASQMDLSPAELGFGRRFGSGWTERVLDLLDAHGPCALAYHEAVLRAADQRASAMSVEDPLLREVTQ